MPSHHLTLLFLIPFTLGFTPECSEPNSCYGMPVNCRPDTDCHLILKFDAQGNLDLHVNDITDPMGYVAVALDTREEDGETEYVICIPHQQQRLRGIAQRDEPVRITEQPMAKYVTRLSANAFVCSFLATELPPNFQSREVFSVVEGVYEDNLVIPQGEQLSEPLYLHPVAFRSLDSEDSDDVMTPDERKTASDLLGKVRRINGGDDTELEVEENEVEEDALEDLLDKKYSTRKRDEEKKKASRRRQEDSEEETPRRKSKSRPSRYQEEDEEEEEEEEEEVPKRRSNKKSRRTDSEEEEDEAEEGDEEHPRKKKKGKKGGRGGRKEKREEDEEEDDDEYTDEQGSNEDEDEDNGSNHVAPFVVTAVLVIFMNMQ